MSLKVGDLIPIGGKGGDLLFAYGLKIEGIINKGETLVADYIFVSKYPEAEQDTTFQWFRGEDRYGEFAEIEGATNKEYTIVEDDVDNYIKVEVTVKDSAGRTGLEIPMWSDNAIMDVDDHSGPGSKMLIAGTMQEGFFGEVDASELFTANEISSACGISQGVAQNENEPWLKFAIDGKIIYRPRKTIRHSISWNSINAANCVYGGSEGKRVTKNGQTYIVRLMKGALTDPSLFNATDRGAKGSEWNRLMLPIHEQAIDKSWAYPNNVEENVPVWNHNFGTGANGMYTDADLMIHYDHGNGSYNWCQETRNTDTTLRVYRGYVGASFSAAFSPSSTDYGRGWAPVLELVEED